ncbi:MAG: phytoene/squalene synthase family protein [Stellaceae bacterium]
MAERLTPVAALVRRHDRDRFQTALFAPAAARGALFALYAFNYEIARVRESVSEPILGHIRLEWWREAVAAAFSGGPVRRHDVVEAVTGAIRAHNLSRNLLDRLIDARNADFDEDPPPTLAVLEAYAEATSSGLISLALEVLGVRNAAAAEAARHVGIAYALAGLLRALPLLAGKRPIIPADIALRVGSGAADRATPALCAAAAEIGTAALAHLQAKPKSIPRAALPALLPARIARHALRRLARAGWNPFEPALARPDSLQSWRLAIAALRRRI